MAANLHSAEVLREPISRCTCDPLNSTETGHNIGGLNKFFRELEDAVAILHNKYSYRGGKLSTMQRLMSLREMVARSLRKMYGKIICHKFIRCTQGLFLPIHSMGNLKWICC